MRHSSPSYCHLKNYTDDILPGGGNFHQSTGFIRALTAANDSQYLDHLSQRLGVCRAPFGRFFFRPSCECGGPNFSRDMSVRCGDQEDRKYDVETPHALRVPNVDDSSFRLV